MIIQLISSPRNVSTALMYSFGQRSDTLCVDEPYYSCYLQFSNKNHPAQEIILESQSTDRSIVRQQLQELSNKTMVLFIKNMAHHLTLDDIKNQNSWKHCFLIRHPKRIIQSFAKVIPDVKSEDLGLEKQRMFYDYLINQGHHPIVIDSTDIVNHPREILQKLCAELKLPFEKLMLSWPKGPKPYDGVWAPYWYHSVHQSTGFVQSPQTIIPPLSPRLQPLLNSQIHHYDYLSQFKI
ncbi:sulfotransferase-like domain-containing protein [Membranihabitans marinus]|uniref:sulfotransferase-like domain-containing protein n=1 Tax=Membranihabitans marinus TaxID=1227546 RepID=UPI001F2E4DDC|nr:hypothetical protein [Membranihabitans marinus]